MARLGALHEELAKYHKETLQEVREIVADNGSDLELRAQRSLESYTDGQLDNLNFINLDKETKDGGYSVSVGPKGVDISKKSRLAVYIEFGTGLSAKNILAEYPKEIQDLAMTYFETGDGTLKGHPYLFNNYLVVRDNFIKELNAYLKTRDK